jgi:hypothetical protein
MWGERKAMPRGAREARATVTRGNDEVDRSGRAQAGTRCRGRTESRPGRDTQIKAQFLIVPES